MIGGCSDGQNASLDSSQVHRAHPPGSPARMTILSWKLVAHHPTPPNDTTTTSDIEQVVALLRHHLPSVAVLETEWTDSQAKEFLTLQHEQIPDYRHVEILSSTSTKSGTLLMVSKQPFQSRQSRPSITYRMGDTEQHFRFGILDVTISAQNTTSIRILAVSIKDKVFHPEGQSEMRRNEFRVVSRHVRRIIEAIPQTRLLLLGCLNDNPNSAGLRSLMYGTSPPLLDLRPVDADGDAWTHHCPDDDRYYRNDYALLYSGILPEHPPIASRVMDELETRRLSLHRPLWVMWSAQMTPPSPGY